MSYQTLKRAVTTRLEIKKSEFIAYAYPVTSREQAMFHVEQLREQYPDARHFCWAYIIGDPDNTTSAGFDDDGEPSGTAGRPILNVLQHKSIGNVIIIVVRYFGGIKLGAGGLTRAYAGSAQAAVDEMILNPYVPMTQIQILAEFATEAQCRYMIESLGGHIDDVAYSKQVTLTATLAEADVENLKERLAMDGRVLDKPEE
ncbi:protein co-occurring with transport system [Psychrobacter nivimaris]|uniref:Protein co-occurring with transport system n=1 Tax=Psychrobacter nivimaris TaxID=281738 RepID=A0A6N7BZN9_9GAMM|nr:MULTISPECIES: YigZ family protein [Psychrobacter]KAF0569429.1 protein co-occurring with transport system [Psychrobacter nivimaris]MBA6245018.1 YigZ family protein [Psychrobacter sp. Urea-trap-18]MBA6286563.1 YigZ family protein [Psychrobacter sp. Urea-trap-16]MBA6318574.1 YigZ family protein [Psychrobacter sp. Urea-trap-20]MBA6334795.1 YigZ family protein [Psychrobacter sp. Urea-trap-19]|tara:strand:- start:97 stop:699 length:603 start_codon:yes stop_codon:yes gene_type:complete